MLWLLEFVLLFEKAIEKSNSFGSTTTWKALSIVLLQLQAYTELCYYQLLSSICNGHTSGRSSIHHLILRECRAAVMV